MVIINDNLYAFYDNEFKINSYTLINQIGEIVLVNPTLKTIAEFIEKFEFDSELEINTIYTENNPYDFDDFISYLKTNKIKCHFKILKNFTYSFLEHADDDYTFETINSNTLEIGLYKFSIIKSNGVSENAIILKYKEFAFTGSSLSSSNTYPTIYNQKQFQNSLKQINKNIPETMLVCPTYGEPTRLNIINYKKKYN